MKKLILFFVLSSLFGVFSFPVFAQEEDNKATPSSKLKIEEIKEKVASTVAALNLVSKKGLVGEITKLEKNKIAIERKEEVKLIDVDELTKYSRSEKDKKSTEIKFSDLDLADTIVAIGLYNRDSRKLLARIVLVKSVDININGVVREVDIKGNTLTVEDKKNNETYLIDVKNTTIIRNYTKGEDLTKITLAKVEIGQRAHVNGRKDSQDTGRLAAFRILLLPGKAIDILSPPASKEATAPAISPPSPAGATATEAEKPAKKKATPTPQE